MDIIGKVTGVINLAKSVGRVFGLSKDEWGVFDKKKKMIANAVSVVSVDYRNGSKVSDYPVEQGSFASYNKVASPYEVRVRMVCDGNPPLGLSSLLNPFESTGHAKTRTAFMDALDAAVASTDLYTVVTPEKTYKNATIESWDYRREATNGASIIIADLYIREVRELVPKTTAKKSANPAAATPKAQGQVAAAPVTTGMAAAIKSAAAGLESVKAAVTGVISSVRNAISGVVGAITGAITGAVTAVTGAITGAITSASTAATGAITSVGSKINTALSGITK
jgi:hypothetical protein